MYKRLKPVSVDILLDLDMFVEEYGEFIEREPDPSEVRPLIDDHRTYVLRDKLGKCLFSGMCYERPGLKKQIPQNEIEEHVKYILDYLKGDVLPEDTIAPKNFYYMKLKESKDNPNRYFLGIVLKSGFTTYMETNPSEKMKIFLQDILRLLYENNLTDNEIVGYYVRLSLNGDNSFKNNFKRFLMGEI